MSYILGFIVADGSISKRRGRKDSYLMNITNKEREHLENISNAMSSRYKIGSKRSGYTGKKDCYYIQVSNKEICKDLINLGIIPRKTYNLEPIYVPDNYFSDFVRGFFDGDGSVYLYDVNGTPQIKGMFLGASFLFMEQFNKQLCRSLGIPLKTIHREPPSRKDQKLDRNYIDFYISDCEKLAEFMYSNNPELYLPRKRDIFEKWKKIERRHYIKQNYPSKVGWRLNEKVSQK